MGKADKYLNRLYFWFYIVRNCSSYLLVIQSTTCQHWIRIKGSTESIFLCHEPLLVSIRIKGVKLSLVPDGLQYEIGSAPALVKFPTQSNTLLLVFFEENAIDGDTFMNLTRDDLPDLLGKKSTFKERKDLWDCLRLVVRSFVQTMEWWNWSEYRSFWDKNLSLLTFLCAACGRLIL